MDYDKIKLGLIGKFKVWQERRIAEAKRNQYYKDEGELLEVDYSSADKLQEDLLSQKRIKKATKDATKLYRRYLRKDNDGIGESDFVEDYLVKNGLKQKSLPKPKKHSFMDKYPVEKTEEEKAYEQSRQMKTMYYEIDGEKYEIPLIFSNKYLNQMQKEDFDLSFKLITNDEVNYVMKTEDMKPEDKYSMLMEMLDISLSQMGEETYMIAMAKPDTELKETFPRLTRQLSRGESNAKKSYAEGKVEEANSILEKMAADMLKFYKEMSKDEEEEIGR